jgi:DNA-directed RNA polymerase subunit alpha
MIPLPQPTKVIESKENHGVFTVEGLYPGYGVTIGNSLRRVLLSSLEGAAVTQAKIKGVDHEFTTVAGMAEDVLSVLLQLKQLRFKLHSDDEQVATLKIKGEKEVKGSDLKLPSNLELANPELVICHLTDKSAELDLEIHVGKGVGYVPAEERKKEKQEIGTISLDAIYTPIRKVSSRVENMRVGDRTDFNRLIVEIETDGTVSPKDAFYQSTDILLKQFDTVLQGVQEKVSRQDQDSNEKDVPKKVVKKTGKKIAVKKETKTKK